MNFKDQLFHSSSSLSKNNILKLGGKIIVENILFPNKSIKRLMPPIFYDWFTFLENLKRLRAIPLDLALLSSNCPLITLSTNIERNIIFHTKLVWRKEVLYFNIYFYSEKKKFYKESIIFSKKVLKH